MAQDPLDGLRPFVEALDRQKTDKKDKIIKSFTAGPIPVNEDTLLEFTNLFVTDALDVLKSHPGFPLAYKFQSLRNVLLLFEQAARDLSSILDRFDTFSRTDKFYHPSHEDDQIGIDASVRKEIYAFVSLAHALQDHCRRITKSSWQPDNYKFVLGSYFCVEGQHEFVCGLRNALHHLSMVEAGWQIRNSGSDATSHYVFHTSELLSVQEWSAKAGFYLKRSGDEIDVRELTADYKERVSSFYQWLFAKFDENMPSAVADYHRCWNAHQCQSHRRTYKFFIQEFIKRNVDPYFHLEKYLTYTQMSEVNCLTKRSREQVDLIITMIDRFGACDDELRLLAYRLFGVG